MEGDYDEIDEGKGVLCEGCGEIGGCCPLCCRSIYSPGSEQCDSCEYNEECYLMGIQTSKSERKTGTR
jgi:hypothetical protein